MPTDNKSEIVIFKTADEKISVDVRFEGETVWLTQAQLVVHTAFKKGHWSVEKGTFGVQKRTA